MKIAYTSCIASALITLTIMGCSSSIKNLEDPSFMQRELVIQASQQCEAADMRPRIVYGYQVIQDRRVAIPLDVQCEPSAWRKSR